MPLSKFFGELPVFALKGTAFCRESNRVGGNSSDWGISDLSHHRSCGSASGGSTNLTYDTPFGVVITHGD